MPASSNQSHADIRIRATRSWPRDHGEEAPYLALTASDKAELRRVAQIITSEPSPLKHFHKAMTPLSPIS